MCDIDELLELADHLLQEMDVMSDKNKEMTETIRERVEKVLKLQNLIEDQTKSELEALMQEESELQSRLNRAGEAKELSQQEQQLRQEYNSLQQNVKELSSQCGDLEHKKSKLAEQKEELLDEKERLENETTIMIPKRREEINLYNLITRIRWDFEGSKDELRGYVSNKDEVKPFNFDKRKCSQFFITNALWDLMEEKD